MQSNVKSGFILALGNRVACQFENTSSGVHRVLVLRLLQNALAKLCLPSFEFRASVFRSRALSCQATVASQ